MDQALRQYTLTKIDKDTYSIKDNSMKQIGVYMYLLIGRDKALLIDSGYGVLNLPEIIRQITDKEVVCVCTHGHVDHALGAYQFEKAYLHAADFALYREHSDPEMIRRCGYKGIGFPVSKKRAQDPAYRKNVEEWAAQPRRELLPLDDVKAFDLGGRIVSWRLVPGHTQGSAVFLDENTGTVFDSDAAHAGVWLFLPEALPLRQFRENMADYLAYLQSHAVGKLYGGHSAKPSETKGVQKLIRLSDKVLEGRKRGVRVHMSLGDARIVFGCGTMMFLNPVDEVFWKKG